MASKKISLFIPLFAMMLPLAGCEASSQFVPQSEAEAQGYTRIDFEWTSNDKTEGQDYFYYTDDFFKKPASESDMAFAHASYAWALANFPSDPKELTDYSNKSRYARKLSEKLGFTDFVCNNWYKIKPTNGSIGITCSKKAIDLGDGTSTTVILVGIRGAAYEAEWASNVTLGEEGDATGFSDAAAEVSMFVSDYVTDHSISGPIKVWVSGYSRAAATTNLFAGHLDETALDGISAFSEGVTYKKDDIYAFCFEPPAGADAEKGDLHSEDFNNIKCYINPDDLVPYVAPKYFGFTRYGEQLFYPSPLKTLKYREYENKMLSLLNPYIRNGHPNYKAYSIPQFKPLSGGGENKKAVFGVDERKINWTLELQMGAFIENLASNGLYDRFPYTNTVQPGLARAITMVFDHAAGETAPFVKAIQAMIPELLNLNLSSALIDDLMIDELRPYFGTDFIPFLIRAFRKTLPDMPISDIESISTGLSDLFTAIAEATAVEPALTASLVSMTNISAITYTHYPELNYFWIKAMNPLIMKDPIPLNPKQTYQMIWSWGVKDLELRDESGTLVMKFKDGEPVALNSTYTYGIRTETSEGEKMDEYYLYFPADQSYELTMSGDEGEAAQFVLSYFNPATSEYIRHAGESFNYEKDTPYTYSVPSFSL